MAAGNSGKQKRNALSHYALRARFAIGKGARAREQTHYTNLAATIGAWARS